MLDEIKQRLKRKRQLSFSHWRYQLLHWWWGIRPTTRWESPLPAYLYTHYCPLFHLTNLIALFILPIAAWKCCRYLFVLTWSLTAATTKLIGRILSPVLEAFCDQMDRYAAWRRARRRAAQEAAAAAKPADDGTNPYTIALQKAEQRSWLINLMKENPSLAYIDGTDKIDIDFLHHACPAYDREELVAVFEKLSESIKTAKARAEARKARMKQLITTWVNVSSFVVKWLLNITYFAAGLLLLYGIYEYGAPAALAVVHFVGSVIAWIFQWNFLPILKEIFYWIGVVAAGLIGLAVVLYPIVKLCRTNVMQMALTKAGETVDNRIAPPFRAVMDILGAGLRRLENAFIGTIEFCAMFYEENCPPVEIVSEEDEELQAISEG